MNRALASEEAPPAVLTEGLGRRYGRNWALAHVDISIAEGESVLLAGANGSGKTTLLRLLAGTASPTAGSVRLFGWDRVKYRLECRRLVSMVSHETYLYDRLTAGETVQLWSRLLGERSPRDVVLRRLASVGLAERADDRTGGFSAGMKKRLTLLRTRLEQPRLVLLDEPMAALDPPGQQLVSDWIADFKSGGATVVFASHAIDRALSIADRVLHLEQGQIVWQGSTRNFDPSVLDRPRSLASELVGVSS